MMSSMTTPIPMRAPTARNDMSTPTRKQEKLQPNVPRVEFRLTIEGLTREQCQRLLDMVNAIVNGWGHRIRHGYYRNVRK